MDDHGTSESATTEGSGSIMEPMVERWLEHRGTSLYYRLWPSAGDRPPLLLLHGFGSNSTRWNAFAETTSVRADRPILCPDLRGHGHSRWRGRLSSEDWVADCRAILEREGFPGAVIGGHCLGANIALRFAHACPDAARGLVLVEPMFPHALTGTLGRLRRLRRLLPVLALAVRAANAMGIRRRNLPLMDLAALDRETRAGMAATGDASLLTGRYGSVRHDLRYMATAAYLQALGEVVRPLPSPAGIRTPALALLSQGGMFGDPGITREALRALPAVDIEELAAHHWIPTEQPEAMAAAIEQWLRAPGAR